MTISQEKAYAITSNKTILLKNTQQRSFLIVLLTFFSDRLTINITFLPNHPVVDPEIVHEEGNRHEILSTTCRDHNVLVWFPLDFRVGNSFFFFRRHRLYALLLLHIYKSQYISRKNSFSLFWWLLKFTVKSITFVLKSGRRNSFVLAPKGCRDIIALFC